MLSNNNRQLLKQLAKESIKYGFANQQPLVIDLSTMPDELSEQRATFVTLEKNNRLRGCIGMLEAQRALAEDVAINSYAAAFSDARFPPVEYYELANLAIQISILNPAEQIKIQSERDLIKQLQPGNDGLIIEDNAHRATFLPSVWQSLPNAEDFVHHLKVKAGFKDGYWSQDIRAYRYSTESF
jgi:AmmeMemoRadiSam system protein A